MVSAGIRLSDTVIASRQEDRSLPVDSVTAVAVVSLSVQLLQLLYVFTDSG